MKQITIFLVFCQWLLYLSSSTNALLPCGLKTANVPKETSEIDTKILKCLCKIKSNTGSEDIVDLSSLDCRDKKAMIPPKGTTYNVTINLQWIKGYKNSMVNISEKGNGNEFTLQYLKKIKGENSPKFVEGSMNYGKPPDLFKIDGKNLEILCENSLKKGSYGYNYLKIVKAVILDGKDCPINKGAVTTARKKIPLTLTFNEKLKCDEIITMSLVMSSRAVGLEEKALSTHFSFSVPKNSDCEPK